ncbi:hypothetical protein [Streptomyces carminius]|uniref:hypothetical protein n=1 Tax=Streptomyces carminius TaxID=2665496 RepID=UPI001E2CB5A0|nr:hypothetical protein [Streptomyces carminius]
MDVAGHPGVDGHVDDDAVQVAAGLGQGVQDTSEDQGEFGVVDRRHRGLPHTFVAAVLVGGQALRQVVGRDLGVEVAPGGARLDAEPLGHGGDLLLDGVLNGRQREGHPLAGQLRECLGNGFPERLGVPHGHILGAGLGPAPGRCAERAGSGAVLRGVGLAARR